MKKSILQRLLILALALCPLLIYADAIQIAPIRVTLSNDQTVSVIKVSNQGNQPAVLQINAMSCARSVPIIRFSSQLQRNDKRAPGRPTGCPLFFDSCKRKKPCYADCNEGGLLMSEQPAGADDVAYCVKCKAKQPMKETKVVTMKNGRDAKQGKCSVCGTGMYKILAKAK